jgi:hypothetical protein
LPRIPWLAVLDREVTTTAQEGLYVVYLFSDSLDRVYLSMNQGVTAHQGYFREQGVPSPDSAAIDELRRESELLRAGLGAAATGLLNQIELGGDGFFPRAYEAGAIVSQAYDVRSLPGEAQLLAELDGFLAIYRDCVSARDRLHIRRPGDLRVPTRARSVDTGSPEPEPEQVFRPKDASDYTAFVRSHKQRRTRKHEDLVQRFGKWASGQGLAPRTNVHPRDLVRNGPGGEWLIEAEVVRNNAEPAVREAIGQLYAYRHFYYRVQDRPEPILAAMFSGPIGDAFVQLLDTLSIIAIWNEHSDWHTFSPDVLHVGPSQPD